MATAAHEFATHDELLAAELATDPEFAAEWERLAVARMLAVQLIRYRSVHDVSQRAFAAKLGVSQPRIVELESGERNPTFDIMVKIAAATGLEFAIDIAPAGRAPQLVGKAVRDTPDGDGARARTDRGPLPTARVEVQVSSSASPTMKPSGPRTKQSR